MCTEWIRFLGRTKEVQHYQFLLILNVDWDDTMRYEKKQFIHQLDFIIFIFRYTIVLHAVSFLQSSSFDHPMFVLCTGYFLCFRTCCPFSYVFYQTKYHLLMSWSWKDEKSEHQNRSPFLFRLAIHRLQKWWLEHCNLYSSDIWGT